MAAKGQCLICDAPPANPAEEEEVKVGKVWGREMEVMFALQQVLQVPTALLANFLAETATGNVGLLTLCPPCRQLVGECREVDEQLQKLKRRWIKCSARVVAKVKVDPAADDEEPPEGGALAGKDDLRKEARRFVINHAYPFGELKRILDKQMVMEEPEAEPRTSNCNADPLPNDENCNVGSEPGTRIDTTHDINAVAIAAGDGMDVPRPKQAPGESVDVSTTHEIAAVTPTEGGGDIGVAVDGFGATRNGSSDAGGQDQTPKISRDAGSDRDEGQVEVTSCSRNNPRPVPVTRPCSVLLQRIDVPRAGGGKIRVSEAGEEGTAALTGTKDDNYKTPKNGRNANRTAGKRKLILKKIRPGPRKLARLSPKVSTHECLFCCKKFQCNAGLVRHMYVHTEERPFWCAVCGKEFNQKSSLKKHQRTHTGDKPYQCKLCPKRFADSSNLTRHVKTHLGEKLWKCPECGKAFVQKSALTAHLVVHTGEKPYKCDRCPRKYAQLCGLSADKKRKH